MAKGSEFINDMEPATSVGSYGKMTNNNNVKNATDNQPRGETSDFDNREKPKRGRKRGSTNANLSNVEPRRRKRESEVIVGERIRLLRQEARLSQEELGKASKMSTSYISRLETGEVNPTVDALTRIVRVFGLTIDGLLELNAKSPILTSDELDPEIRVWLFKLKGRQVSDSTKHIIQAVIKEELERPTNG